MHIFVLRLLLGFLFIKNYHYLNTPSHPVVRDLKSLQIKSSSEVNLRLYRIASVVMEGE